MTPRCQGGRSGRIFCRSVVVICALFTLPLSALPESEGVFPVDTPNYQGVDRVLVLSGEWVAVVSDNMKVLLAEINTLSGGEFGVAVDKWEGSQKNPKPNYAALKQSTRIRDKHIAQARINVGERLRSQPQFYHIQSDDDPRYSEEKPPADVATFIAGLGGSRFAGAPDVDFVHYAYLKMPAAMKTGSHYTITVKDKTAVTFLFDESRTVSRAIKVNQAGYMPDAAHKFAYLGAHLYAAGPMDCSAYTTFDVVNTATGEVAFTGPIKLRDKNSRVVPKKAPKPGETPPLIHGEDLYEMDFTGLKATGTFFIRIPGVGRSWPFRHSADAYGEVFYTATRGMYHQRCGIAYEAPYTSWKRPLCHTDPVYESDHIIFPRGEVGRPKTYLRFDVIGATTDKTRKTEDARGGWHDAADWDRGSHHYTVIFDLLYAYELAPSHFSDGQLNLPESGNGIPDILDEAAYGLKVWTKSMNADGGVAGHVETWTHPRIDGDADYAYSQRTRWDSLLYAAAAAQLAQHVRPFDEAMCATLTANALKAYAYGSDPAHSLGKAVFKSRKNRGRGDPYTVEWEEKDSYIAPYMIHAKVRLFRLTGDNSYMEGLSRLLAAPFRPYQWPNTMADYSPWIFFSMIYGEEGFLPPLQRNKIMKPYYIEPADELIAMLEEMPYRHSWPTSKAYGMGWGASVMTNPGRALLIAYKLTGEAKYRDAALQNMDFMFGANPMGMSWTTGVGYVYPTDIQHEVSQDDGIADPVPGITVYSVTSGIYPALRKQVWQSPGGTMSGDPVVFQDVIPPLWRRWSCHPRLNAAECEFTVQETISSTIFCAAMMLPENWKPDEALRTRTPRDLADLHGRWYLP